MKIIPLGRVTLYVRVWIETIVKLEHGVWVSSPSTWGCGLKHMNLHRLYLSESSPSTWGCGLKLLIDVRKKKIKRVTLYVRVWIETSWRRAGKDSDTCHPLREGVDWNNDDATNIALYAVTLYVRVWIETVAERSVFIFAESPSTWGCGLKPVRTEKAESGGAVTLYVRVWIETEFIVWSSARRFCHPLREGVDWNKSTTITKNLFQRHPLREGVDWNLKQYSQLGKILVTLYVRVWIETTHTRIYKVSRKVTLYVRVWIETSYLALVQESKQSPSTWGCGLKLVYRQMK